MNFWFIINGEQSGPYTLDQAAQIPFQSNSPAWRTGLPQWVNANQIPELAQILEQRRLRSSVQYHNMPSPQVPVTEQQAPQPQEITLEEVRDEPQEQPENLGEPEPRVAESETQTQEPLRFNEQQPKMPAAYVSPQGQNHPNEQKRPSTYLVWSILATVLCCVPTGIAAIIFSVKASSKADRYDFEGARKNAEIAQWLVIISITLGLVWSPFSALIASL